MSAAEAPMRYRIGVDENGLGPLLGPMIVTAVLARVTRAGFGVVDRKARGKLADRLGDSKDLVSHRDVSLAEAWARALVERGCGGDTRPCATPDELIHAISLEGRASLRAPCPGGVEAQCWGHAGEAFEADGELVRTVARDLCRLAERGVEIVAVRSVIACPKLLNEALEQGRNRFHVDLHAMERLVLSLRERAGVDVHAVCGKVGGFGKYGAAFGPLAGRLFVTLEEGRARSAYRFQGIGEIAFVQDADANDLLVSMASLVGKYMREALMARVVRFYKGEMPGLPEASGYHDPVTRSFVHATEPLRRLRVVPSVCFERRGADSAPEPKRPGARASAT